MQATGTWIGAWALSILAGGLYSTCGSAQVSTQYPYCLQGDDYPGWSNCTFTSFQQCQASASGTLDECMANPWYQAGTDTATPSPQGSTSSDGPIRIGPPPK
ncbi:DUF3551 domain-containing protein [Bradyrhizobium sp. TZ2]